MAATYNIGPYTRGDTTPIKFRFKSQQSDKTTVPLDLAGATMRLVIIWDYGAITKVSPTGIVVEAAPDDTGAIKSQVTWYPQANETSGIPFGPNARYKLQRTDGYVRTFLQGTFETS